MDINLEKKKRFYEAEFKFDFEIIEELKNISVELMKKYYFLYRLKPKFK